jgi:hypothetical protein
MVKYLFLVLVCCSITCSLPITSASERLQEKPEDTIRKAIKAHGGRDRLAKYLTYWLRAKGTLSGPDGDTYPMLAEYWYRYPECSKIIINLKLSGGEETAVRVHKGNNAWAMKNGVTANADEEDLKQLQKESYETYLSRLYPLLEERGITLTALAETKVNGSQVVGVQIISPRCREMRIYFDKTTMLISKIEYRGEYRRKKVLTEEFFSDYREISGLKYAGKKQTLLNGKKHLEGEIVEFKLLDLIDDKEFAKP